ncbi:hypothetical protein ABEB36_013966 [Hypothenemus hampei]|uniref:THAP-type domain-containing protein n=1 Tax=Hypothenemus hampei TaxID=57062 RepID=A0ABD1E2W7_HYPHA
MRNELKLPRDESRFSKWKSLFPPTSKINQHDADYCYGHFRLCNLHFENQKFSSLQKNRLKRNSIPKIDLLEQLELQETNGDADRLRMAFSNEEMTDMVKILGFCEDNLADCVGVYAVRFPNRRQPDRRTFARVERSLRETGKFAPKSFDRSRPPIEAALEEQILNRVAENPTISTRRLALEFEVLIVNED